MSVFDWPDFGHDSTGLHLTPDERQAIGGRLRHAGVPFRFLQASDLRLDMPCRGISEFPERHRDLLFDARYLAAQRVFDAAIGYDVDFVILAGGVLDVEFPGLRGPWFLAEQFRRLAEHGIDVYWSGATHETRGRWPVHVEIPTNVHRLTADETGILHGRGGHPIARLLTIPAGNSQSKLANGAFTIAVQPRCQGVPERFRAGIDYWALGGQPDHETVQVGEVVAHFAGSPQGRGPSEVGRHSCSLVNVDAEGSVKIHSVLTDVVRWHQQRVAVDRETSWSDLEQRLITLQSQLRSDSQVELNLVHWTATGGGLAAQRLSQPRFQRELATRLNAAAPKGSAAMWTASIDVVLEPAPRSVRQQQTPLEAFLMELDAAAPHLDEMFGAAVGELHPLGELADDERQQMAALVEREGTYWLGTDDRRQRHAG